VVGLKLSAQAAEALGAHRDARGARVL
jgi:hypothetical protein